MLEMLGKRVALVLMCPRLYARDEAKGALSTIWEIVGDGHT